MPWAQGPTTRVDGSAAFGAWGTRQTQSVVPGDCNAEGGILCGDNFPADNKNEEEEWEDPNPEDPDWRKIAQEMGGTFHRGGDIGCDPIEAGCDCYFTYHRVDTNGVSLCWEVMKCYGPDGELYYRIRFYPCKAWWGRLPPCPPTIDLAKPNLRAGGVRWGKDCGNTLHRGVNCIRNIVQNGPGQQCCYDGDGNLVTHGPSAGTPDKVGTCNKVDGNDCCKPSSKYKMIDHAATEKVIWFWDLLTFSDWPLAGDWRRGVNQYLAEFPPYGGPVWSAWMSGVADDRTTAAGGTVPMRMSDPSPKPWPKFPPVKNQW
jgi:hypothetical protein